MLLRRWAPHADIEQLKPPGINAGSGPVQPSVSRTVWVWSCPTCLLQSVAATVCAPSGPCMQLDAIDQRKLLVVPTKLSGPRGRI